MPLYYELYLYTGKGEDEEERIYRLLSNQPFPSPLETQFYVSCMDVAPDLTPDPECLHLEVTGYEHRSILDEDLFDGGKGQIKYSLDEDFYMIVAPAMGEEVHTELPDLTEKALFRAGWERTK